MLIRFFSLRGYSNLSPLALIEKQNKQDYFHERRQIKIVNKINKDDDD